MISLSDPNIGKGALMSECDTYRYMLQRYIIDQLDCRWVYWVLNNPSTADHETDDATVRRTWAFTQSWGYNGMLIGNTNPYRCTNPTAQRVPPAEVLAFNEGCLTHAMAQCKLTVCGWGDGALPELTRRTALTLHGVGPIHALRVTKAGNPTHPLYQPRTIQPKLWRPTKWLQ